MKIIKTKTYLGMKDQIGRLTKQVLKQQGELHNLHNELGEQKHNFWEKDMELEKLAIDIYDLKKEIKRLKTLCTKNNICYEKETKCKK